MTYKEFLRVYDNDTTSGIYLITCLINNKNYIGSSCNIRERIYIHYSRLNRGVHHNQKLQSDFDEFGIDNFDFYVLEIVDDLDQLLEREENCKSKVDVNFLYNGISQSRDIILSDDQIKYFWSKVNQKSDYECWEWIGTVDKDGYGKINFRINGKKIDLRSHKIAYTLRNQKQIGQKIVCHTCDNPKCCNPKHLKLDSFKKNNEERGKKGRSKNHKYSDELILKIKTMYKNGKTRAEIFDYIQLNGIDMNYNTLGIYIHNKVRKYIQP